MLEVIALTVDDAREARRGGADRIELVGTMNDDGLSPTLDMIKEIQDEVGIPIRAMLRTEADFATTEPERLLELAHYFSELQVDGVVLGYLDKEQVDTALMQKILAEISTEYTFHRAIDYAVDYRQAFKDVTELGGNLTSILTGGSASGVKDNLEKLTDLARDYADLMLIGGGLAEEFVPQLKAAGLQNFHVGSKVRPHGDFAQVIDPYLVERWKLLTD